MGVTPKPFIILGGVIIRKETQINLRISLKDKKEIEKKAQKCKMNFSEYMIASSLNTNIIVEKDNSEYITELRRIGNNINQLTKKVNQGILSEVNLSEVKKELNKIWQLLSS